MSQNLRNQQSDSQAISGRALNENLERKSREWFDGMNYEQKRQPYNSEKTNYRNGSIGNKQNGAKPHGES